MICPTFVLRDFSGRTHFWGSRSLVARPWWELASVVHDLLLLDLGGNPRCGFRFLAVRSWWEFTCVVLGHLITTSMGTHVVVFGHLSATWGEAGAAGFVKLGVAIV